MAGTIHDPVEKEVIIDANYTLTDTESGNKFKTSTEHFGDLWFHDLDDNRKFSLEIKKGKVVIFIDNITTDIDVNLGDLPLE